ncbi:MAG TPA: hypothetical protein VHU87_00915 [Rhizomicrobium sp.]|jgi:hypothetical protein|nr:hypothetical protein [Rhizomicrobium sp.]
MRNVVTLLAGFAALILSGSAFAAAPAAAADTSTVPTVLPGDDIAIACDALSKSDANSDVRVVLTISAMPGETKPGIKRVMATNEEIMKGAVRVRVPTVSELGDQTVNLNVYVVDDKGSKSCDAGHVKIADQVPLARKKS